MSRFPNDYPADWPAISARVKEEAGNRCVRCGHPAGDAMRRVRVDSLATGPLVKDRVPCDERCAHPRDGKLRTLTVHHLDGDKANGAWWNLLALCQVCHLCVQSRVIVERPWILAHSEWFVPYVCGYYAAYYGKLVITRDEAMADPARFLAMGQPQLYETASGGRA